MNEKLAHEAEKFAAHLKQADDQNLLSGLLALLRAMHWMHWTAHWVSKGMPYYGDHLLFERLYTGMTDEIDTLAEKLVAGFGAEAVCPKCQSKLMANIVASQVEQPDIVMRAKDSEDILQVVLKAIFESLEDRDELSLGMNDFLAALANAHETNQYLLGQRLGGVKGRVAARYMVKQA